VEWREVVEKDEGSSLSLRGPAPEGELGMPAGVGKKKEGTRFEPADYGWGERSFQSWGS